MVSHKAYQLALRVYLQTLATLPVSRAWENKKFDRDYPTPYVEEEYLPGTLTRITQAKNNAWLQADPVYIVKLSYPIDAGISAITTVADALLTHFAPGTTVTAGNGDVLYVRGDVAPVRSQLMQLDGWAVLSVSIPLRTQTQNAV